MRARKSSAAHRFDRCRAVPATFTSAISRSMPPVAMVQLVTRCTGTSAAQLRLDLLDHLRACPR